MEGLGRGRERGLARTLESPESTEPLSDGALAPHDVPVLGIVSSRGRVFGDRWESRLGGRLELESRSRWTPPGVNSGAEKGASFNSI